MRNKIPEVNKPQKREIRTQAQFVESVDIENLKDLELVVKLLDKGRQRILLRPPK